MKELILYADDVGVGERLDKFISENAQGVSRSYAAVLAEDKNVFVNGKAEPKKYRIQAGDEIKILLPEPEAAEAEPEDIPLDIIYEDSQLIVINKPQGMVVHPAAGNLSGTLVNALLYHCGGELSAINGVIRPGIVHRIDKDTSGLLVAAKNNDAHLFLAEQIKMRKANRRYEALLNGKLKEGGIVNKPIARHPSDRKKMSVSAGGREAVTHYNPIEIFSAGYTLTECVLETGRTHQIRVHMASIGHSVVGDKIYGIKKEKFSLKGQLLHAKTLGFVHPISGEYMEFSAPVPEYFEDVLKKLRQFEQKL